MKKNIKELFKQTKLLILDVDGVLTKGEIIYDDQGRELKIFNVKDGFGVFLLGSVGIKTVLLSAKNSPILKKRAFDMKVAEVIGGILPKESVLGRITKKYKVKPSQICFIGDDLIDVGMISRVGAGITVADAPPEVKKCASYVTEKKGGEGAVREIVDLILEAQNHQNRVLRWLKKPR